MAGTRLKEWCPGYGQPTAPGVFVSRLVDFTLLKRFETALAGLFHCTDMRPVLYWGACAVAWRWSIPGWTDNPYLGYFVERNCLELRTTLIGESLGSCVDEERGQLRELV